MTNRMTRKQALNAAGSAGAALIAARTGFFDRLVAATPAAAAATTTVTPSMTEGPYWIDEMLRRSNVRANTASASHAGVVQQGVPLTLKIKVLEAGNANAPVNGAHVDVWHANAAGLYSDEASQQVGSGTTASNTKGENFLRGYQITGTDAGSGSSPVDGQVLFETIWPGWYTGRAIHIHVRVRTYSSSGAAVTNYTTQIFFTNAANASVLSGAAPYSSRSPQIDPTTDDNDNVLTSSAKATNVVGVSGSIKTGYTATFTIVLAGGSSSSGGSPGGGAQSVSASIAGAKVVRTKTARTVVLTVETNQTVTAHAHLVRGAHVIGKATGQLPAGTHVLSLAVAPSAASGSASVQLTLVGASGSTKVVKTSVTLPAA